MLKSKDGTIEIFEAATLADVIFPAYAWAVVNTPIDSKEAVTVFSHLFDTATSRSVLMALCRHKRKDRVSAVKNLPNESWQYLETISVFYEKPSTCSNNGFLPISEAAFLFFKGTQPDAKKTEWFSQEHKNATNLWNVAPQPTEGGTYSYYQKFNWEMNLLLMNLSDPIENNKFIYTQPLDKNEQVSLFKFCKKFNMKAFLYSDSSDESKEILNNYKKFTEAK